MPDRQGEQFLHTTMFALQFQIEPLIFSMLIFFIFCNKFSAPKQIERGKHVKLSNTVYIYIYWPMGEV